MEIDSDEDKNWQKEIAIRLKFMKLLIKNGHIVDPTVPLNQVMDLLIEDGKIIKVEKNVIQSVLVTKAVQKEQPESEDQEDAS